MANRAFESYTIILRGTRGKYTVESTGSKNIRVQPIRFEWNPSLELQSVIQLMEKGAKVPSLQIKEFGTALYKALFLPPIILELGKLQGKLKNSEECRIILQIESTELARLPWECLYDGNGFLSARKNMPLSRIIHSALTNQKRLSVSGPLKILFIGASPQDTSAINLREIGSQLNSLLGESIKHKQIILDFLFDATKKELHNKLLNSKHPYHVLYFAGHSDGSYLYFDDGEGNVQNGQRLPGDCDKVSAADLSRELEGKQIRLVFLSACESTGITTTDGSMSIANELIQTAKLPALVAMQYKIGDEASNRLAAEFFRAIAAFFPVDSALAEARKVLIIKDQTPTDFVAPVLFLQVADATLFQKRKDWLFISLVSLFVAIIIIIYFAIQSTQNLQLANVESTKGAVINITAQAESTKRHEAQATAQAEGITRATAESQAVERGIIASARELANASIKNLDIDPELSILLAVEAAKLAPIPNSEDALRQALYTSQVRATLRGYDQSQQYNGGGGYTLGVRMASFSPDSQLVVTASGDGIARIWKVSDFSFVTELRGVGNIKMAVFSPDNQQVITSNGDGIGRIWDVVTGHLIVELLGHSESINTATFNQNGQFVVTASDDHTARVWNAKTGQQICILSGHTSEVDTAEFSPDGKSIVTSSLDKTARIWDANNCSEKLALVGHEDGVNKATYSPDGKMVATASKDMTAIIWDTQNGSVIHKLTNHFGEVMDVDFDPFGRFIVTAGADDVARIWEIKTGNQVWVLSGHNDIVMSARFSKNGKWVVTAGLHDNTARIWDVETGIALSVLKGHTARVNYATFSPDSQWVITASEDTTARLWSTTNYEVASYPGYKGTSSQWILSDDSKFLATLENYEYDQNGHLVNNEYQRVWIWNLNNNSLSATLRGYHSNIGSFIFSHNSAQIATGHEDSGEIDIWDLISGKELENWKSDNESISYLGFTTDDKYLISYGNKNILQVWNTSIWKEAHKLQFPDNSDLIFDPKCMWISLFNRKDGIIKTWDTTSWSEKDTQFPESSIKPDYYTNGMVFSPNNKMLARLYITQKPDGSSGGYLQVLDTSSWKILYERTRESPIDNVFFSPDSQLMLFNSNDGVSVVDTQNMDEKLILKGHSEDITDVAFSHYGHLFATSSYDYTAKIWDGETGKELTTLTGHQDSVFSIAFSPDDQKVVTTSEDGTARLWYVKTGEQISILRGYDGPVQNAWFTTDGRLIEVQGAGGVRIYAGSIEVLLEIAKTRITRDFFCNERTAYLHESKVCPSP